MPNTVGNYLLFSVFFHTLGNVFNRKNSSIFRSITHTALNYILLIILLDCIQADKSMNQTMILMTAFSILETMHQCVLSKIFVGREIDKPEISVIQSPTS